MLEKRNWVEDYREDVRQYFLYNFNNEKMIMKYKRIYRMLVAYGHSGAKALEVITDARSGDHNAVFWIIGIWVANRYKRVVESSGLGLTP